MSVVSFVSSSANAGASTSLIVTAPAGIQDDDILIAYAHNYNAARKTITPPTGFTEAVFHGTTSSQMAYLWWKRAASESGNYTFTTEATTAFSAHILVFRGCATVGSPVDAISESAYIVSNTTVRAASMTTTAKGARVWAGMCAQSSPTLAVPAGWTQASTVISTNYRTTSGYICDAEEYTPGATGDQDGTITGGNSTTKNAIMLQLKVMVPTIISTTTVPVPLPLAVKLGSIDTCTSIYNFDGAKSVDTEDIAVSAETTYHTSLYVYAPTLGSELTISAETGTSHEVAVITEANEDWVRYDVTTPTAGGETTLHLTFDFAGGTSSLVYVTGCLVQAGALGDYFDGDFWNCVWSGVHQQSASTRLWSS